MKNIPIRQIHVTHTEPGVLETFSIREVRDVLGGKDMVQELHRHDFFFILVLKKGKGTHEIEFTSHNIGDRSVFFMRPGQVHRLVLKAGSIGYLMEFKPDFYPHDTVSHQLLRKASDKNRCQLDANGFKKLLDVSSVIFEEHSGKQESYKEVIKANLVVFFIELVRQQNCIRSSNQVNPYAQERLDQFLELVETHLFNHKEVSYYADQLNLSIYQLNSITKATLGKTSSELINEHIILETKRYLLATSNQVTQIAQYLGYEDVSYFIRFFKKHTGYSPETFRINFK